MRIALGFLLLAAAFLVVRSTENERTAAPSPPPSPPPFTTAEANAMVRLRLTLTPITPCRDVSLWVALPVELPLRQELVALRSSHAIAETTHWAGNNVARFSLPELDEPVEIDLWLELRVEPYSIENLPHVHALSDDERRQFTAPEVGIESDHHTLTAAAEVLRGEPGAQWIEAATRWVVDHVRYPGFVASRAGAAEVLRQASGDCSDMTDLLVAVCRAGGVPARHAYGLALEHGATVRHSWAEVWSAAEGWIPIDPLYIKLGDADFGALERDHVQLMNSTGDAALDPHWYFRWRTGEGTLTPRFEPELHLR